LIGILCADKVPHRPVLTCGNLGLFMQSQTDERWCNLLSYSSGVVILDGQTDSRTRVL
jgi:hypothetical protein